MQFSTILINMTENNSIFSNLKQYFVGSNIDDIDAVLANEITLYDNEEKIHAGRVYISTYEDLNSAFLKEAEDGSIMIVSNMTNKSQTPSVPENCTWIGFNCSLPKVYNTLQNFLIEKSKVVTTFADAWRQIVEGRSSNEELRAVLNKMPYPVHSFTRLAIITFDNWHEVPFNAILLRVQELFGEVNITRSNGIIIALLSSEERNFKYELSEANKVILNTLLEKYHGSMVISNATRKLKGLAAIFYLAQKTSALVRKVRFDENQYIFNEEDYNVYTTIDLAVAYYFSQDKDNDILYLAHPAAVTIIRHDQEYKDNLQDVFYYYLTNERNLQKTAEITFMHRNTVLNKVKKIKSLIDVDLEDQAIRQRLIFSFQLIRYYEKVLGGKVR